MDGPFYVDTRAPHWAADNASQTLSTTFLPIVAAANLPVLGQSYFSYVGKAVRMRLFGRMTTGATPGNGQFGLFWGNGTAANGTNLGSSPATALSINQTNTSWIAELVIRCRALGTSGSLMLTGWIKHNEATLAPLLQIPGSAPVATTVDLTTTALLLSPQYLRSGSTAETMQVHDMVFEALN